MGLVMEISSPPGSSPANDDIELPDAPPTSNSTATQEGDANKVALEDLFDQDDSDSEFPTPSVMPSSPPAPAGPSNAGPVAAPTLQSECFSDPTIMLQFYSRLFPFRTLFQWLNHSPKPGPDFGNREFAFTLSNDAYLRYQSYPTHDLLRKDILRLNPSRFEIGPVYTTNPRDRKTLRKSSMFKPLSKEIVFDIDLTDYDDIRSCCVKANICLKCWAFATMAIKVVDVALRDDFGFDHIMWVYSGRRGVHAWISDKDARDLEDDKRKAITGYFDLFKTGVQGGKRINVRRPLHPHLVRSLDILKPYFQQVLEDQDPFVSTAGQERLLKLLPDKNLNEALRKKWESTPERASTRKWADIDALASQGVSKTLDTKQLMEAKQDILLEYTYPRLDVEVGKKKNHLLKSPFVVHPGTGRVCVPITATGDMKEAEDFDPLTVPKVTELLREIDEYKAGDASFDSSTMIPTDNTGPEGTQIKDWEKTRLKPYVEAFDGFVRAMIKSESVRVKRERDEDGMTGSNGMEF